MLTTVEETKMALLRTVVNHDNIGSVTKNGFILVTGGLDYISLNVLEEAYIQDVEEASDGVEVHHVEASTSPRFAEALKCSAVPTIFHIVDSQVIGQFIGVGGVEQIKAYLATGVSPV